MKKRYFLNGFMSFIVFLSFAGFAAAITESEKQAAQQEVSKALKPVQMQPDIMKPRGETTGLLWLQMSIGDRMESILFSI